MKHTNIYIIGVPEGEERDQGIQNLFEDTMTENFCNLVKEKDTQVQEAQRIPNKMNPKSPTLRNIIIKMVKVKKIRILKEARERKLVSYKGALVRLSAVFSTHHLFRPEGIGMKYSK